MDFRFYVILVNAYTFMDNVLIKTNVNDSDIGTLDYDTHTNNAFN